MSEKLETYDLEGNLLGIQDRDEFYKEIKEEFAKTGKITRKVKTVRVLLMNSSGRIYLQKRSRIKAENAGLYDKTVGGHVVAGDSFNMTMIRECAEELGFPLAVLSKEEFDNAIKNTDLNIIGVGREIDYNASFESVRIEKDGQEIIQPLMNDTFICYYDGSIKFCDGESSGIELSSIEELKDDMAENPNKYTNDIKVMIEKYAEYLKPIKA